MPGRIAQSAKTTLEEFKVAADRIINASTGEAKADLAKAVATAAGQVARDTATKQKIKSGTCVPFADAADKNRTTGWTMP